ncbi:MULTISPECIES: hypothetical protein [unclassified Kitasatospora]|uniref:hypothetical protein n=1 Tax=unclassified Kitasatospora TaxID=2633591 RepID=UPI0032B02013
MISWILGRSCSTRRAVSAADVRLRSRRWSAPSTVTMLRVGFTAAVSDQPVGTSPRCQAPHWLTSFTNRGSVRTVLATSCRVTAQAWIRPGSSTGATGPAASSRRRSAGRSAACGSSTTRSAACWVIGCLQRTRYDGQGARLLRRIRPRAGFTRSVGLTRPDDRRDDRSAARDEWSNGVRAVGRSARAAGWPRLRALSGALSGRPDSVLERAILGQLAMSDAAVVEAHLVSTGESIPAEAALRSEANRRTGEQANRRQSRELRDEVSTRLVRCLTTPIDREDLLRVSHAVDGGTHVLHEFVREFDLYGPTSPDRLVPLTQGIVGLVAGLRTAVSGLVNHRRSPAADVAGTHLAAAALERAHQEQMVALVTAPATGESLRMLALLGRLDQVRVQLLLATDALADGAMKRGL